MKYFPFFMFLLFLNCNIKTETLTSKQILEKSIQKHDAKNLWNVTDVKLHIEEPRIANPYRYSILKLSNSNNSFELQRNREKSISTHKIDSEGNSSTLLDGKITTDSLLIKKYRLNPERNFGYKRFYQLLLGLPMSLKNEEITIKDTLVKTYFNDKKSYKVSIKLAKPMFSKNWNLYFSEIDFSILGVEMVFPDDIKKGERIIFDDIIKINSILIPRIRNWHNLDNTYSGSDILLKELK